MATPLRGQPGPFPSLGICSILPTLEAPQSTLLQALLFPTSSPLLMIHLLVRMPSSQTSPNPTCPRKAPWALLVPGISGSWSRPNPLQVSFPTAHAISFSGLPVKVSPETDSPAAGNCRTQGPLTTATSKDPQTQDSPVYDTNPHFLTHGGKLRREERVVGVESFCRSGSLGCRWEPGRLGARASWEWEAGSPGSWRRGSPWQAV